MSSLPAQDAISGEIFDCAKTTKDVLSFVLSKVQLLRPDGSPCVTNDIGVSAVGAQPRWLQQRISAARAAPSIG